jgi:uncharacterized delta-60 repeat protein
MVRVAILTLLLVLAFAGPAHAADRCRAPGAHTVLENSTARLFWVKGKGQTKRVYLGCRRGHRPIRVATNRFTEATRSDPYTSVTNRRFRLSGRWVAWIRSSYVDFGVGELSSAVMVRPLGGGGRRVQQGLGSYGNAYALRVSSTGAVAWILRPGQRPPDAPYSEVGGVATHAKVPDTLAYARAVSPHLLRLADSTVTWRQDDTLRSAVLRRGTRAPAPGADGPQRLDPRFGECGITTGPEGALPRRLARVPGGGIVLAGTGAPKPGPVTPIADSFLVARMSDDGKLDASFGNGGIVEVVVPHPQPSFDVRLTGAAVQPDGKIVLGGYVLLGNNSDRRAVLARLDADGTLDESFGGDGIVEDALPGRSAPINDIALTPGGEIIAVGGVRGLHRTGAASDPDAQLAVARFRPDGSLDPTFGEDGVAATPGLGDSEANAVRLLADGSILAAGRSSAQFALARLRPDGSFDHMSFESPAGSAAATALTVAPDGAVWVTGTATNINGFDQFALGRYTTDGSADKSFGRDGFRIDRGVARPTSVALDPSGRLVVAASVAVAFNGGLARYLADGSRDGAFGHGGKLTGVRTDGNSGDVLLNADGSALLVRFADGRFGVMRFALDEPALSAAGAACAPGSG